MSAQPDPRYPSRARRPTRRPSVNPPVPTEDRRVDPPQVPQPPALTEPPPATAPAIKVDPTIRTARNGGVFPKRLPKITFGKGVSILILLLCIFLGSGCTSGNARLESGGAYAAEGQAPDYAFYAVESGYALALAAFKTASRLEIDNRATFWAISPTIKHTLDEIRPKALAADRAYSKARVAYLKTPTPDGLSNLQTILGQIQQLAAASVAAIPKQNP